MHKINQLTFGTLDAVYQGKSRQKEETTMKNTIARKTAYIGAGAGLVLFALFGLLPGSLLGGAMGINIAGWIFGLPLDPGFFPGSSSWHPCSWESWSRAL